MRPRRTACLPNRHSKQTEHRRAQSPSTRSHRPPCRSRPRSLRRGTRCAAGATAGAWGPPGAAVPAAGSAQPSKAPGGSAPPQPLAPFGDRPENILKESPAHCHCSQIGYKTMEAKAIPPGGLSRVPGHAGDRRCHPARPVGTGTQGAGNGPQGAPRQADRPGDMAQGTPDYGRRRL